jgi:hypothetical protein
MPVSLFESYLYYMLDPRRKPLQERCLPVEIMPKNSCWVLVNPDISRDIDSIVFDHWSPVAVPLSGKQLSHLGEACESPITFISVEPVICSYNRCSVGFQQVSAREYVL